MNRKIMTSEPDVFDYKESNGLIVLYIKKEASEGILIHINMQMIVSKRCLN